MGEKVRPVSSFKTADFNSLLPQPREGRGVCWRDRAGNRPVVHAWNVQPSGFSPSTLSRPFLLFFFGGEGVEEGSRAGLGGTDSNNLARRARFHLPVDSTQCQRRRTRHVTLGRRLGTDKLLTYLCVQSVDMQRRVRWKLGHQIS